MALRPEVLYQAFHLCCVLLLSATHGRQHAEFTRPWLGVARRHALHRLGIAELLTHRIDERLVAIFLFDLTHRYQHDKEREQQRHHVAERDNPFRMPIAGASSFMFDS